MSSLFGQQQVRAVMNLYAGSFVAPLVWFVATPEDLNNDRRFAEAPVQQHPSQCCVYRAPYPGPRERYEMSRRRLVGLGVENVSTP